MVFSFKFQLGLLVCYYVVPKLTRKNMFATVAISLRSKCRLTGLNPEGLIFTIFRQMPQEVFLAEKFC